MNEAAVQPLGGACLHVGLFGLALIFNAQFTMHNAQLTLARRSCLKSCLTTPSPKCFHHSRAESPPNSAQSRLRTNRPPPIRRRRNKQSTPSLRGSKRGRERIIRTGEREGETLRRENHTQNLRFPLLRLAFSGTFPSCGLPLAGRGRIVPITQNEGAQQNANKHGAEALPQTNPPDSHRIAREPRHISLL